MDDENVALGSQGMAVEAARICANYSKEWKAVVHICRRLSVTRPYLFGSCVV